MQHSTYYRTIQLGGLSIFYREAGAKGRAHAAPAARPSLFVAHVRAAVRAALRTSSTWSRPTIRASGTATGRTRSSSPTRSITIAEIMNRFTEALGLTRYTLYMQDYGGPVGFRMALAHPDRIEALIVQDAVAHNEGLGRELEGAARVLGRSRGEREQRCAPTFCRWRPRGRVTSGTTRTWNVRSGSLDRRIRLPEPTRPGRYPERPVLRLSHERGGLPEVAGWMRETQPRLLVLWGKYDLSFELSEPEAYRRTCRSAQFTFSMRDISRSTPPRTRSPA